MAYPALFLSAAFIGVTIFLQGCVVYWQERRAGVSHEHALHESTVVSLFFVGPRPFTIWRSFPNMPENHID